MLCDIYRASSREGMYLYVAAPTDAVVDGQPEAAIVDPLVLLSDPLKRAFGRATFAMRLQLSAERKLARAPVQDVIASIESKGYFLQLPPEGLINPNAVAPEGLRGA
jgi:uncharacterized protein YcgL (UPF0745 family)